MSALMKIFRESFEKFPKHPSDITQSYLEEIDLQIQKPVNDFCTQYIELTFIYIRYTGCLDYYKNINPYLPTSESDQILYLLSHLRSNLAQTLSTLYLSCLCKSNQIVNCFLEYNTQINIGLVKTIEHFDTLLQTDYPEEYFHVSVIEFAEFIQYVKEVLKQKAFKEDDLEFVLACCLHFGYSVGRGKETEKFVEALGIIFERYCDDLETLDSAFSLKLIVLYKLFTVGTSVSQILLNTLQTQILHIYFKPLSLSLHTTSLSTVNTNSTILHNLFLLTHFTDWTPLSPSLLSKLTSFHKSKLLNFHSLTS